MTTCPATLYCKIRLGLALGLAVLFGLVTAPPSPAQPVIGAGTAVNLPGPPELRDHQPAKRHNRIGSDPSNRFMPEDRAEAANLAGVPVGPMPAQPVVVELFTAQGCSSCPAADALLANMAGRPDLLALSFHVDYWDYLGWQDEFASPEFTTRQEAYSVAFGERGLYTPQFIIGGADTLLTPRPADVEALIDAHRAQPPALAVTLERDGPRHILTLTPHKNAHQPAEILFLRYLPQRLVQMDSGENRGRQVEYRNIVSRMDKLADWDGSKTLRLSVSPGDGGSDTIDFRGQPLPPDTRHAIIVQQAGPGPILAAIRLD